MRRAQGEQDITVSVGRDELVSGPRGTAGTPRLPKPGDVVGNKYRIEQCIGQGGMGAVFRATQLLSEKPVALKRMLRPPSNQQTRARFLREARAVGRIHHPNVVDIYDVWQEVEFDYLVMELLHGESLRDRLDRGPLRLAEAVDLLMPAMLGVAAAHRAGVIHRDLKPDNVFLCDGTHGTAAEAKVLDFGISHIAAPDVLDPTLTRDGAVLGTPAYMSPEQLKSARGVDVRTDVYSFAVIFYEAITGRRPFCAESFSALVLAIAQTDPAPPSSFVPDLPRVFERVLMRALARDRERRYPDMDSFIAAVRPFGSRGAARTAHPAAVLQAVPAAHAELPLPAPAVARPRSLWPGLAIALTALLLIAWWASRADEAGMAAAEKQLAATPAPAAASPPAPAATVAAESAVVSDVSAREAESSAPAADAPAPPVRRARRASRSDTARAPALSNTTSAQTRANSSEPVPARAHPVGRSGTISLDDM